MKLTYIPTFAIVLFSTFIASSAQSTVSMRISSIVADPSDVVEVRLPGPGGGPHIQILAGDINASSEEGCMGSRDFSNVRPVGPETATLVYDPILASYSLRWTVPKSLQTPCRVLVVGETASSADYAIWRANYGSSGLTGEAPKSDSVLGHINSPAWGYDRIDD